ncbi:MAG: ABC transporter permease [Gemmatimonadota bacterium]|nr:MAG: ABC transporter permease [Gemmatimonadota bacterium]
MDTLKQDIGYALRLFKRSPGFTAIAALTIALGIGPTTTIFSVANALLHRTPAGVRNPAGLVSVYASEEGGFRWGTMSYPVFEDYRDAENGLDGLAAVEAFPASLSTSGVGDPEVVTGLAASASYFAVLGTRPAFGRFFLPDEDDAPAANPVVVLSHRIWARRFGADSAVIGTTVNLNRNSFTVIGVAEEGFHGHVAGYDVALWVPIGMREAVTGHDLSDNVSGLAAVGRLATGWSLDRAAAAAGVISRRLRARHPDIFEDHALTVAPYSVMLDEARGPVTLFMALLLVVTGILLLIASVNVGSVMLSRAMGRSREVAVRLAVGAGRWRLVRQLLTESVLLFTLGGSAGILLALWATRGLSAIQLPVPVPVVFDFAPDLRVLVFTLIVAFAAGTLFGLAPALQATRQDLVTALKANPGDAPGGRSRLRSVFVVAQVSGSVVLLVAAGMFLRALGRADAVDLGFDPNGVHVLTVDVSIHRYTREEGKGFQARLLERAAALPGVESAGLASILPLGFTQGSTQFTLPGHEPVPGKGLRRADFSMVTPGYFETMRIGIVAGRAFDEGDREGSAPVLIVNQTAARQFWAAEGAVGKLILWGETPYEVVGVASDGKYRSIGDAPRPMVYLALAQRHASEVSLVARTVPGAPRIDRPVREIALELDPDLPVQTNAPYAQIIGLSLLPNRVAALMTLGFGALGLLLAAVGLFGVLSYGVSQRTREIGIRIALGASVRDVNALVMGQGLRLTGTGLVIGCLAAFGAAQLIRGLLFGVSPADPVAFGSIALVFAAVGLLASYLPARRATRTDPLTALRQE